MEKLHIGAFVEFIQCSVNPRTCAEESKCFFRLLQTEAKESNNTSNADLDIPKKTITLYRCPYEARSPSNIESSSVLPMFEEQNQKPCENQRF